MKNTILGLAGIAALTAATVSLAGGPPPHKAPAAFYVGGGVGYANTKNDVGTYRVNDPTGYALNPFVGYQFNRDIALEGGYTFFSKATGNNARGSANYFSSPITVKSSLTYLAAKLTWPLSRRVDIYAKLGAARVSADYSSAVTATSAGNTVEVPGGVHNSIEPYAGVGFGFKVCRSGEIQFQAAGVKDNSSKATPQLFAATVAYSHYFAL